MLAFPFSLIFHRLLFICPQVPLFYEPSKPSAFYMLGSAILQHSQVKSASIFIQSFTIFVIFDD
jgi:hypothetical protein